MVDSKVQEYPILIGDLNSHQSWRHILVQWMSFIRNDTMYLHFHLIFLKQLLPEEKATRYKRCRRPKSYTSRSQ